MTLKVIFNPPPPGGVFYASEILGIKARLQRVLGTCYERAEVNRRVQSVRDFADFEDCQRRHRRLTRRISRRFLQPDTHCVSGFLLSDAVCRPIRVFWTPCRVSTSPHPVVRVLDAFRRPSRFALSSVAAAVVELRRFQDCFFAV